MFVARLQNGQLFSLIDTSVSSPIDRDGSFFCPVCHESVILKQGTHRRRHFAHKQQSSCRFAEAESQYHMLGKDRLFHWLQTQHITDLQLEPYLPEIQQRPDLLFTYCDVSIPLEFQCSSLSKQVFQERMKGYHSQHLFPLWIQGAHRLKQESTSLIHLDQLDWLILQYRPHTAGFSTLIYFHPSNDLFTIVYLLFPVTTKKVMASVKQCPSSHLSIEQLVQNKWPAPPFPYDDYQSFILQRRLTMHRYRDPLYRYLDNVYRSKGRSLSLFPSESAIPCRYAFTIETPPILWQSWLLFCFLPLYRSQRVFSIHYVIQAFKKMEQRQFFKVRKRDDYQNVLLDYLYRLDKLGVLKNVGAGRFKNRKAVTIPKTMDEAIERDKQFFSRE